VIFKSFKFDYSFIAMYFFGSFLFFFSNFILLGFFSYQILSLFFLLLFFFLLQVFLLNTFYAISSFKIKFTENQVPWFNTGLRFHKLQVLEIRPGLKGSSGFTWFFPSFFLSLFFLFLISLFRFCFFIF